MNKRAQYILLTILLTAGSCQQSTYKRNISKNRYNEAVQTMSQFRKTSPLLLDDERLFLLNKFETYSDALDNTIFREYFTSPEGEAINMEDTIPILYCYREAFDKALYEVKNNKIKKGTAEIWMLYNMGFVVKTPTGCFGIDIDHKYAVELEPYLDFLCVTHNHGDHYNMDLMKAMIEKGKPVLSNFYNESEEYMSKVPTNYTIGDFTIQTDISDHLANPKYPDFVTVFRIECNKDAGNFSMLHAGDSGFNPKHFTHVEGPVSMAVLRWGAPRENNILGTGKGQVKTNYAVLSHLIELRHKPYPHGQASITQTLKHLPNVACENTIMPFWGEKMEWKNNKLN